MREVVVLHEFAHHVTWHTAGATGHGEQFQEVYLSLLENAVGPGGGVCRARRSVAGRPGTGLRRRAGSRW